MIPLLTLLSPPAAAASFRLTYDQQIAPVALDAAPLQIQVVNARPLEEGLEDPRRIGTIRGGYGNGFAMVTDDKSPSLTTWLEVWLEDVAGATGHPVTPASAPVLRLTVTRLWTDGYMGNWMEFAGGLELLDPVSGAPRWSDSFLQKGGAFLAAGLFSAPVLGRMLNDVVAELTPRVVEDLRSPAFVAAVDSILAQPAGEAAAAPPSVASLPLAPVSALPSARAAEMARLAALREQEEEERRRWRGGVLGLGVSGGAGSFASLDVELRAAHWMIGLTGGVGPDLGLRIGINNRWFFGSRSNLYQPGVELRLSFSPEAYGTAYGYGDTDDIYALLGAGYDGELYLGKKTALHAGFGVALDTACAQDGDATAVYCVDYGLGVYGQGGVRQWF